MATRVSVRDICIIIQIPLKGVDCLQLKCCGIYNRRVAVTQRPKEAGTVLWGCAAPVWLREAAAHGLSQDPASVHRP